MNKDEILEELKSSSIKICPSGGDCISIYEYAQQNYKPWTFELTSDKGKIDESWFPNKNKDSVSGDYFGLYPSMPTWRNEFYSVDGKPVNNDQIRFVANFPGTGASLCVYRKL